MTPEEHAALTADVRARRDSALQHAASLIGRTGDAAENGYLSALYSAKLAHDYLAMFDEIDGRQVVPA